ncbi:hypothetical protein AFL01nite_05110 [Aeromicrobium flavum]|uniref:Uncharacterized protein n=1 Tax=Aeromicrobium flavum TaxID=416568 RepID=A0A512HRV3_9ACTN|nr:hypothetical protein [Aeromicrobium flavum]GEO88184.1 hypothetical protein AFL01nite_05110 [Aeromicrobium flavum]
MGIADSGNLFATTRSNQLSKKYTKQQKQVANDAAARDAQVLEHLAYQSQVLSEIRDLLRAQGK